MFLKSIFNSYFQYNYYEDINKIKKISLELICYILNILAFILCLLWLFLTPSFEPAISSITLFIAILSFNSRNDLLGQTIYQHRLFIGTIAIILTIIILGLSITRGSQSYGIKGDGNNRNKITIQK